MSGIRFWSDFIGMTCVLNEGMHELQGNISNESLIDGKPRDDMSYHLVERFISD